MRLTQAAKQLIAVRHPEYKLTKNGEWLLIRKVPKDDPTGYPPGWHIMRVVDVILNSNDARGGQVWLENVKVGAARKYTRKEE